jgi:hypothetical protein
VTHPQRVDGIRHLIRSQIWRLEDSQQREQEEERREHERDVSGFLAPHQAEDLRHEEQEEGDGQRCVGHAHVLAPGGTPTTFVGVDYGGRSSTVYVLARARAGVIEIVDYVEVAK